MDIYLTHDVKQGLIDLPDGAIRGISGYGPDPRMRMMRSGAPINSTGGVMILGQHNIGDHELFRSNLSNAALLSSLTSAIVQECRLRNFSAVFLDLPPFINEKLITSLSNEASDIMIISSGNYDEPVNSHCAALIPKPDLAFIPQLESFKTKNQGKKLFIVLAPLCLLYKMPDINNSPTSLSFAAAAELKEKKRAAVWRDNSLMYNYFLYPESQISSSLCLFDDEASFAEKIAASKTRGYSSVLISYHMLSDLIGNGKVSEFIGKIKKQT